MKYIVVDNFILDRCWVLNEGNTEETKVFSNLKMAERAANNSCQNGIVVPMFKGTTTVLSQCLEVLQKINKGEKVDTARLENTLKFILNKK